MQRIIFTCKSPDSPENRFQYHRQLNILEASFGSTNHFTHVLLIFLIDGQRVYYRVRFLSKPHTILATVFEHDRGRPQRTTSVYNHVQDQSDCSGTNRRLSPNNNLINYIGIKSGIGFRILTGYGKNFLGVEQWGRMYIYADRLLTYKMSISPSMRSG